MSPSILALLLLAVVVSADIAPLLHATGPDVVPGSYIVVLKEGKTVQDRTAHITALGKVIAEIGDQTSQLVHVYHIGSFIGFNAILSDAVLKIELASPDVKYIEADQRVSIGSKAPLEFATQQWVGTWGLNRIDQASPILTPPATYSYNITAGENAIVYVIDTGIFIGHVDFGGRAQFSFNAITNEPASDLNGHGTHCAGTIGGSLWGVAKRVQLRAVKVLSASGSGTYAGVILGIDFVYAEYNKTKIPSIASMSLGGPLNAAVDAAVAAAIAGGVTFAIAAGNAYGNACNYSPADVPTAITVGATTITNSIDTKADYSNFGPCVDIFAPGSNIVSAYISTTSNNATSSLSGTSMATPHVAGVLALHLSDNPTLSPAELNQWLVDTAIPDVIASVGTGSPNLLLYSPYH